MPECVSCGKEIAAGTLFCDECYKNMKGMRGSLKQVEPTASPKPEGPVSEPSASGIEAGPDEVGAGPITQQEVRKAIDALTPTSNKKIVSLKPDLEKSAKDKAKSDKKRFKVTISFSERTYQALGRLSHKKADRSTSATGAVPVEPKPKRHTRKAGPYGRPKLKAVGGPDSKGSAKWAYLGRVTAYREREWDSGDKTAGLMATGCMALIMGLCFLSWIRLQWYEGEGEELQTLNIKGIDLGILVYVIMAIAFLAWLYMALSWLRKKPLLNLDFGIVLLITGVVLVIVFFITISSNQRILEVAGDIMGRGGVLAQSGLRYERQNTLPAYLVVLSSAAIAFSGLIRVSSRRADQGEPAGEQRKV